MPSWKRLLPFVPTFAGYREARRRTRFVKRLKARLSKAEALCPIEYDAAGFLLRLSGGQTINLVNFWAEHRELGAEARTKHIEAIAQGLFQAQFDLPEDYEDVRIDLMPKVWARAAFDRIELEVKAQGGEPPSPAMTPLGSHLLLGVVYDLPNSMRTIRSEELDGWDATYYEAMEQAVQNLRSRPMQVGRMTHEDEPGGLFIAMSNDSYDATRMLLIPDLVEAAQMEIEGSPVAMVPCRDALLVTGDDDVMGLVAMADVASKMVENEPRQLAPTLLRHVDGEWVDWHVPDGHPAAERFHQLELRFLKEEYDVQKALLEQIESRRDEPAEVADLLVFKHKESGQWASATVWGRHVRSLLPKADYVALVDEVGSDPVYVPWDDVVTLTGELMDPIDLSPPRWRVSEYPHPKAVEILAETASNPMAETA